MSSPLVEETAAAAMAAVEEEAKPQFEPLGREDDCDVNPEFAVICSFIANFSDLLDVTLNLEQLKYSIEDQSYLDEDLIDLHVKLLKKVRRYFVRDQWEKALIRFASEYSYEDAYELETLGYQKTRPSIKLTLLRRLLDAQFECDQKFKASVNLCEADKLRNLHLGRDVRGNTYWHNMDGEGQFKIYQEQPLDYKSWKAICSRPEELERLIQDLEDIKEEKLKGEPILEPYNPLPEIFPEFFCKKEKEPEKVEETVAVTTKTNRRPAKGRNNRNKKTTNSLTVVKEVEEEDSNSLSYNNNNINTRLDSNDYLADDNQQLNGISKPLPPAIKPPSPTDDCSNESTQVKSTVENLLNKVVSSFEYLISPLNKNPSPSIGTTNKSPPPSPTITDKNSHVEVKSQKKRTTKKERIREEILPRRSSSRIQQLQIKKAAEQEEEMKKKLELKSKFNPLDDDSRSQSSNARNSKRRSESPEERGKNGKRKRRSGQTWRRGKGKKKLAWNEDDSDLSSTSTLTESNDDELDDEEDISFKFDTNYDDEFACEDEETSNNEPVIVKRARTARQSLGLDEQNLNNSSILEEDKPCGRCDKSHDPEWILLCDMCDDGYHTSCCLPPLMLIPDGDWFCPSCEHKTLLTKLKELKTSIDQTLEAKERERMKNQRLRQTTIKKELIKTEIKEEQLPPKRQKDILNELNDPLALQELDHEIEESEDGDDDEDEESDESYRNRRQRGKTRKRANRAAKRTKRKPSRNNAEDEDEPFRFQKNSRKTYSRRQKDLESESEESLTSSSSSEDEIQPKTRRARASVSYRFQEYDELIKSAIREDSYDEDEHSDTGSTSPAKSNFGRGKDMATIEALAYQQENGITESGALDQNMASHRLPSPKPKSKKKGRRLNDLDAASESENTTSDESFKATSATEVEDEDDLTEADISEETDTSIDELIDVKKFKSKKKGKKRSRSYDSDGSDYQPTQSRRAATKKVNYRESTDEDEDIEEYKATKGKGKKNVLSSDSESQASWKSHNTTPVDDDISTSCADSPELKIEEQKEQDIQTDKEPTDSGVSSARTDIVMATVPVAAVPVATVPVVPTPVVATPMVATPVVAAPVVAAPVVAAPVAAAPVSIPAPVFPAPASPSSPPVYTELEVRPKAKIPNNEGVGTKQQHSLNVSIDELLIPQQVKSRPVVVAGSMVKKEPQQQPANIMRVGFGEKVRDPIHELNQYCSESANSTSMFNSYIETLLSKNSPPHPAFYEEDEAAVWNRRGRVKDTE